MLNIKESNGKLASMLLDVLKRKPVTNQEARNHFIECVLDYSWILYCLSPLTLDNNSPLKQHYDYGIKLDTLLGRYKMIGDEFLSDDRVDIFLSQMQAMMMKWEESEERELYKVEKKHYTDGAWKNGSNRGTQSEWTWQEEKADSIKSALERHKDLAFKNLG